MNYPTTNKVNKAIKIITEALLLNNIEDKHAFTAMIVIILKTADVAEIDKDHLFKIITECDFLMRKEDLFDSSKDSK